MLPDIPVQPAAGEALQDQWEIREQLAKKSLKDILDYSKPKL